jgi:hypothetical protein
MIMSRARGGSWVAAWAAESMEAIFSLDFLAGVASGSAGFGGMSGARPDAATFASSAGDGDGVAVGVIGSVVAANRESLSCSEVDGLAGDGEGAGNDGEGSVTEGAGADAWGAGVATGGAMATGGVAGAGAGIVSAGVRIGGSGGACTITGGGGTISG